MAKTKVDIEVELTGLQKVEKSIKGVEGGLEGVGETGAKLVQSMGVTNEKLGEGLENLSGSVGETREAFTQLGGSLKNLGTSGMSGILGLIGPIGMLVSAGILLYETFRQITGAAQEAENAQEAMAAAASDLQSRFESLAEKGVIMAAEEVDKFSMAVLESQFRKEQIQKVQEKYAKSFERIRLALKNVRKSTEELRKTEEIFGKENERTKKKLRALELAQTDLNYQREIAKIQVHKLNVELEDYLHIIEKVADTEETAEKRSTDNLKKDALRLANLSKENDTIRFQNELKDDQIQLNEMLAEVQARNIKTTKDLEDANRKQVKEILKALKQEVGAADEITINEKKQAQERSKLRREQAKKRSEDAKKANESRARLREQELKKDLILTSQIRQVEIKSLFEKNEQALELEKERHRATLELSKGGSKELELEEKRHTLALRTIKEAQQQEDQRIQEEEFQKIQENNLKRVELEYTLAQKMLEAKTQGQGFGTELEKIQFESDQELALLKLQYDTEIEMAKIKGEEIASIQKRFALDSLIITKRTTQEQAAILSDYFAEYSEGFAQAGFNALFFGESFQEATSQVLKSLAQQAVSQSVMKAAEGFGLLAMGLPGSALAFKSSALFAAAASVAGVASNALGGGGAAQTGASPSGQPSTAPTPEREQVTNDSMVFNINFGGAVVYDTKKAAEQALADRLVSIINTPRRGAVQFNRR